MPKISVIVPAFNEEQRIRLCLNSIFEQTIAPKDYEVIVVDNNSTDKTAKIVREQFPQVRLIAEKKQGVVFARMAGIKKARGKIIAFTDADSVVSPYWLKNLFQAYEDPNIVAVGGLSNLEPKNNLVKLVEPVLNAVSPALKLMSGCDLSFRKDAYKKAGGFSPKINFNEDFYISLKIKKTGKVLILKNRGVSTSSRRYTPKDFFPYAARAIINITSIALFDRSVFFNLRPVKNKNKKLSLKDYLVIRPGFFNSRK